jgi:hypothetical protein
VILWALIVVLFDNNTVYLQNGGVFQNMDDCMQRREAIVQVVENQLNFQAVCIQTDQIKVY